MDGHTFKSIRVMMGMTQLQMAKALGYRHKIRVSELERVTNPVTIPQAIGNAVLLMGEDWWHLRRRAVRDWKRKAV